MNTKTVWQSKTFWSDVLTILVSLAMLSDHYFGTHITTNGLWDQALLLLGALGIYGRTTANSQISGIK